MAFKVISDNGTLATVQAADGTVRYVPSSTLETINASAASGGVDSPVINQSPYVARETVSDESDPRLQEIKDQVRKTFPLGRFSDYDPASGKATANDTLAEKQIDIKARNIYDAEKRNAPGYEATNALAAQYGGRGVGKTATPAVEQALDTTADPEVETPIKLSEAQAEPASSPSVAAIGSAPAASEPDALGLMERGFEGQQRALKAAAKSGMQRAEEMASFKEELARQHDKEIERAQSIQEFQSSELKKESAKYDSAVDDLKKLKLDPNRFYANQGTGNKILAALSIALGGMGAGMTGTQNDAMKMISSAVDRDIEAQKADYENKKDVVSARQNAYSMMRMRFSDESQAESATRALMLDNAKLKLEAISSKYDAPDMKAKSDQMMGALDVERGKAYNEFVSTSNAKIGAAVDRQTKIMDLQDKQMAKYVPSIGLVGTPEAAKELRNAQKEVQTINRALDKVLDIQKRVGTEYTKTAARQLAIQQSTIAADAYRRLQGSTRPNPDRDEAYGLVIPQDPTKFDIHGAEPELIKAAKASIANSFNDAVQSAIVVTPEAELRKSGFVGGIVPASLRTSAPSETPQQSGKQYRTGDIVEFRKGNQIQLYRVVGFDQTGEALVEPDKGTR